MTAGPAPGPADAQKARRDGLMLLTLGALVFVLLGAALFNAAPSPSADFRALYYPARCLLQECDLYRAADVLPIYQADSAHFPGDNWKSREIATRNVYPPTAFPFMMPFAFLRWGPAHLLWLCLTVAGILLVSFLTWQMTPDVAPILAGALVALFLINSELLVISSNAAGIVVSLCVIAVCCFLRDRYIALGVVCLAVSLTIKPQETGLVWLYFLLAGGVQRKRALETLLVAVAVGLPALLWVSHVSPHWLHEWSDNLAVFSAHGGINDPGPASSGGHGLAMVISLQSMLSLFRDDPRFYNLGSWVICMPLLPVYHRQYDAKLLLLTIPACVMLWARGGKVAWLALAMTTAGLVSTGDLTWAIVIAVISRMHPPATATAGQVIAAVQVFPAPLVLLAIGVFYLWVYARGSGDRQGA
jgi:hypothetical protein